MFRIWAYDARMWCESVRKLCQKCGESGHERVQEEEECVQELYAVRW